MPYSQGITKNLYPDQNQSISSRIDNYLNYLSNFEDLCADSDY